MQPTSATAPSRWWYLLGALLIAAGVAGAAGWLSTTDDFGDDVALFQRLPVPGDNTVQLYRTGHYTVYVERPAGLPPAPVTAALTAPNGTSVPVRPTSGRHGYRTPVYTGAALAGFTAPAPGPYHLVVTGDPHATVAVGDDLPSSRSMFLRILTTLCLGGLTVVGGVAAIAATLVRRRRTPPAPEPPVHEFSRNRGLR